MHDVAAGRVGQRLGHLHRVIDRALQVERTTALDFIAKICAFDELEDNEVEALVFADVIDPRDVGMIEAGGALRLVAKAANNIFRVHAAPHDLDRHEFLILLVGALGQVNGAHPAAPDFPDQTVSPDSLSCDRVRARFD